MQNTAAALAIWREKEGGREGGREEGRERGREGGGRKRKISVTFKGVLNANNCIHVPLAQTTHHTPSLVQLSRSSALGSVRCQQ